MNKEMGLPKDDGVTISKTLERTMYCVARIKRIELLIVFLISQFAALSRRLDDPRPAACEGYGYATRPIG